jgi:hypothetical protein
MGFWIKLHLTSTTGSLIVPLTADVTTANVPDNKIHVPIAYSSVSSLSYVLYMISDPGYDDKNLYEYSKMTLRIDLICPVKRYESTSKKRLELVCFYESVFG